MSRRVTRMLRKSEQRSDRGIGLRRPQFEIRVLRVPAGDGGVMLRDRLQCVNARGSWRIGIQMILEDLGFYLLQPGLKESRLPEPGQVVGGVRALEILVGRILRVGVIRAERGRRAGPELVARSEHPRMPRACERGNRFRTAPNTGRSWKRAERHLV